MGQLLLIMSKAAIRKIECSVFFSISHLIKRCEVNEEQLMCVHPSLLAAGIKSKLMAYKKKLVQLPAIVAGYLNLQIHKPTDPTKLNEPKTTICALLKDCYSDKLHVMPPARNDLEQSSATLFKALFARSSLGGGSSNDDGVGSPCSDEVGQYLAMGIVVSHHSFIDVVQWWRGQKDVLPAHYQMAMYKQPGKSRIVSTIGTSEQAWRVGSLLQRDNLCHLTSSLTLCVYAHG